METFNARRTGIQPGMWIVFVVRDHSGHIDYARSRSLEML
jgi:hypothetical protein